MPEKFYDNENGLWGFKDEHGSIVIPAVYDKVEDFEYGVAVVQHENQVEWGLIDETGDIILPFEYDSIFVYRNSWVHAKKREDEHLFTGNGDLVLTVNNIKHWYTPEEGVIRVKKTTGWGVIDMKGEAIIDFNYQSIGPCINGFLSYYENDKWGWLSREGGIAVPARFDEVGVLDKDTWFGKSGKVCVIYNYKGEEMRVEPWEKIRDRMGRRF